MARATLALLGACCLAAALLGGRASEPVQPGAQSAFDSRADPTSKSAWASCASQQDSKAVVSGVQAALQQDGYSISMSFEPGMDVHGGEVTVNLTYRGQLAGHQRFDLCISTPECPLRSGTSTLLGLGGQLPDRPVDGVIVEARGWHALTPAYLTTLLCIKVSFGGQLADSAAAVAANPAPPLPTFSCISLAQLALVLSADAALTADHCLTATISFMPHCEVEAAFLNFAVDYHGQQAGLQTFSICDLVACPLPPDKQVNLTISMTPPELPEKPPTLLQPWAPCPGPQGPAVIMSAALYAHKFPPPSEATLMEWSVSFYFDELLAKASVTVTRTHRSVPYHARTLRACDIAACPLQPGHNELSYNFVTLPDAPLDGVIVQLTSRGRQVFCVWIALRNPPLPS